MTKLFTPALVDLRAKMSARLLQRLQRGERLAIVGGPKLGKATLAKQLGVTQPVRVAAGEQWPHRADVHLVCADVTHLHHIPAGWTPIPLAPLPKHQVVAKLSAEAFAATGGHPFLLSAASSEQLRQRQSLLARAARAYSHRPEWRVLQTLLAMGGAPAERYARLKRDIPNLKPTLDFLCCAGWVSRAIYGDRAGVEPVPIFSSPESGAE